MKQMDIFDFLDDVVDVITKELENSNEGVMTLEDLFKNSDDKIDTYLYFPDKKDCDCSEKVYEDVNDFENDIFNFSKDFYSNRRIYLGKDLNNIPLFISSLAKSEYSFIVEIDEFSNISIIPVHKEYDEASIEIIPWD